MNQILLQPTDVLFFKDGRPMTKALAGHGAAWPLPNVINAAFHAALHRGFPKAAVAATPTGAVGHRHRIVKNDASGRRFLVDDGRDRRFGSLVTAGPFPVKEGKYWFLPRPGDCVDNHGPAAALRPSLPGSATGPSSLPKPLRYSLGSLAAPEKTTPGNAWWSRELFEAYLEGKMPPPKGTHAVDDAQIFDAEHAIGVAIDPLTGCAGVGEANGMLYSAHYLRLREQWGLGVLAQCQHAEDKQLLGDLLKAGPGILVGGQLKVCTARSESVGKIECLPRGLTRGKQFKKHGNRVLVKWVLLSPAIWPKMEAGTSRRGTERRGHSGGWLPNWINEEDGAVLLQVVTEDERRRRRSLNYAGKSYASHESAVAIDARLVAAFVPKPLVVSGWAMPDANLGKSGGAQSTELAVPAGAVYYFEAATEQEAEKLAGVLNWHGRDTQPSDLHNRRSTLLGEKGFGLGVCGTWDFLPRSPGNATISGIETKH